MQYPIIDNLIYAYLKNGWTGLDIPETITYEPIQLGSGDPSPDNIRPILPATTLNIGGVDIPVYGGTLDVTTGVLTIDKLYITLWTGAWGYNSTYGVFVDQGVQYAENPVIISNIYPYGGVWNAMPNKSIGYIFTRRIAIKDNSFTTVNELINFLQVNNAVAVVPCYENQIITYQLTPAELASAIGIEDDISHRLKLPLPHYFPHPVIDALQRAASGTQTADDTEILRHYLTPLGIGGI